jgi:hypothetical protein
MPLHSSFRDAEDEIPKPQSKLVAELDRLFPAPDVRPGKTNDRLMYEAGARSVIDELYRRLEED